MTFKQKGWSGFQMKSPMKQTTDEPVVTEEKPSGWEEIKRKYRGTQTDPSPEEYPGWSDKAADLSSVIDEHEETLKSYIKEGMSDDDPKMKQILKSIGDANRGLSLHDDKLIEMADDPKYKHLFYKGPLPESN